MEKQMNRPQLRFPEFRAEWEKKKLELIGEYIGGGTPDTSVEEYWEGNIPWISSSDIIENDIHNINIQKHITDEAIKNSATKKIPANSLIIVSRVGVGKFAINKSVVCTSQDFTNIVIDTKLFNANFSAYNLYKNIDILYSISQGTSIKGFTTIDLKKIELTLPSLPEQTKIASFLTAIDEKIQALKKKHNLLEQYKKGVMQQLFSQELRFKDENGNDFPGWEVKKLGDLGETYGGLSGKSKENFGNGKPYIQYKQIFDDSKIDISRFELVDIGDNENQNKVQFGDVFFTVSSETPNEIGMSSVLLDNVKELYLNSFCFGFRANSLEELNPFFSRYLFRSESFREEIIKLAQGSTRYNMSKIQLLKIEIQMPCLEEQTAIANFLSALDEKINQTQTQIKKTEVWKKGLLQKMFV